MDLNCGCPASVVTGKGAGSSLLRDPTYLYESVAAVARGVHGTGCAVTLKLRSGYDDRGLLRENLLAAQAGGAQFVTLHPRTRREGYAGRALGGHRVRGGSAGRARGRQRGRDEPF